MASMFATGNQVWARTATLEDVAEQGAARLRLRARLEGMPEVSPDWPLPRLLAASATELRFVAVLPDDVGAEPAWSVIAYDADQGRLTWFDATLAPGTPAEVLHDGVAEVTISFFGPKTAIAEALWSDTWDRATVLPLLVKVETVRADGTPNPPLTMRPVRPAGQLEMSASSLVPPAWPSAP
jgi:hypothetical protein